MPQTAEPAPRFDRVMDVSHAAPAGSMLGMLLSSVLLCAPVFILPIKYVDLDAPLGLGMGLVTMVGVMIWAGLCVVAMFAGLVWWFWLETKWYERRQGAPFSATTRVVVDERGLQISDLGRVDWQDVLSLACIPDSDSGVIVRTNHAAIKSVLLRADHDEILPVLHHHMAAWSERCTQAHRQGPKGSYVFKAMVFNWRRFMGWIVAGYAAGAAVAVWMMIESNHGIFETLVAAVFMALLAIWLVWLRPLSQLGTFAARRVQSYELDGLQLRPLDGSDAIDLTGARVLRRSRAGIGYQLDFYSIRPHRGRSLDLISDDQVMSTLMACWRDRAVNFADERQVLWQQDLAP
jgi:hypothetical protein